MILIYNELCQTIDIIRFKQSLTQLLPSKILVALKTGFGLKFKGFME